MNAPRLATVLPWSSVTLPALLPPVSLPVVLTTPEAFWPMPPVAVRVTSPPLPLTAPSKVMRWPVPTALVVARLTPRPATEPALGAVPSTTKLPPVVVIEARPVPLVVTAPVTLSPPVVSFRVKVPLATLNAPRLATVLLALPRLVAPTELPVSLPVVLIRPVAVWLMKPPELRLTVFAPTSSSWLTAMPPTVVVSVTLPPAVKPTAPPLPSTAFNVSMVRFSVSVKLRYPVLPARVAIRLPELFIV